MSTEPKKKSGKGLPRAMTLNDNAIDYVHWDDRNELVDRLRLLEASRQAGHNAQRDTIDYRGTSRSWHHYKLTHVSLKQTSRSVSLGSKNANQQIWTIRTEKRR